MPFLISKHQFDALRLTEKDEILGGDLHYFGPIAFEGNANDYDLEQMMEKKANEKLEEFSARGTPARKVEEAAAEEV